MANKAKTGLTYFPFEVTFFNDIKLRKLIKYQGCKATAVYTLLLCDIYKNGYYIMWDNELPFIISEVTGYEEGYVKEVITCCLKVNLFDEGMFKKNKVLTSKGIQDRYRLICKQIKRKHEISEFEIIDSEELGIVTEELPNNTEGMGINTEELLQSKVKEIKEKENKLSFIIIGGETFQKTCSEILQDEYQSTLEVHLMGMLKGINKEKLLAEMDLEYPNYKFADANHFSNSVKSVGRKILFKNESTGKNKPTPTQSISNF